MEEDTFLQMIQNSAEEGGSLLTSWEPGRRGHFYFVTTKSRARRAEKWLDNTMNTLLTQYGLNKCATVFNAIENEMPREETKVRPDSVIMDYIQTLDLGTSTHRDREGKERAPPDNRPAKKESFNNLWR